MKINTKKYETNEEHITIRYNDINENKQDKFIETIKECSELKTIQRTEKEKLKEIVKIINPIIFGKMKNGYYTQYYQKKMSHYNMKIMAGYNFKILNTIIYKILKEKIDENNKDRYIIENITKTDYTNKKEDSIIVREIKPIQTITETEIEEIIN